MTLEAHALTKAYRTVVALHELSFVAGAGEVIGLLGPNGAGKTTAIRVLTTILAPSAGRFAVAGVPHTRPAEIRRRIGVLPESAGYPDRQTGAEFLRYHARLYGHSAPSARATAAALLEEVGLAERGGSPIANYSRGMRQRSASPGRCSTIRRSCSSTSRRSGWTRPARSRSCAWCAASPVSAPRPSSSARICSPRSRRCARGC